MNTLPAYFLFFLLLASACSSDVKSTESAAPTCLSSEDFKHFCHQNNSIHYESFEREGEESLEINLSISSDRIDFYWDSYCGRVYVQNQNDNLFEIECWTYSTELLGKELIYKKIHFADVRFDLKNGDFECNILIDSSFLKRTPEQLTDEYHRILQVEKDKGAFKKGIENYDYISAYLSDLAYATILLKDEKFLTLFVEAYHDMSELHVPGPNRDYLRYTKLINHV